MMQEITLRIRFYGISNFVFNLTIGGALQMAYDGKRDLDSLHQLKYNNF